MSNISGLGEDFALRSGGAATGREPDEEYDVIDVLDLDEVKLGRQGENDTQTVRIDCSAWLTELPGCQLTVAALRPGEREIYLPEVSVANGIVTWPILLQDTAYAGWGRAEVRGILNGKVKKSKLFKTYIFPSLDGDGTPNPPTPPEWAVQVLNAVADAQEAAATAESLIDEATATAIYAVRYDTAQGLTDAQKIQARSNAAAAEDVIEEPGRNLFYLTAGAHTYADLTFTLNDDGSFNVTSGGSTVSSTRLVPIMGCTSQTNYRVPAGTYVFGYTKSNETAAANFTLRWYSASNTGGSEVTPGTPFTLASASALVLRFGSGNAYGGTYHCELEAGTVLHRYVPAKKTAVDTVARADAEYATAGVDRLEPVVTQTADELAEFENTVEIELAGKVQISQGAAQAGKALVVGEDGNVTTGEAGIPEAVKTALLEIFKHVAYVDANGQTWYQALADSLTPNDHVLFSLQSPITLNGVDQVIDSGVKLHDTDKSYTVLIDAIEDNIDWSQYQTTTGSASVLMLDRYSHRLMATSWANQSKLEYWFAQNRNGSGTSVSTEKSVSYSNKPSSSNKRIRLAITHSSGSDAWNMRYTIDGTEATGARYDGVYYYMQSDYSVIAGGNNYSDPENPSNCFKATYNIFDIYDVAIDSSAIDAFIQNGIIPSL